MGPVPETSRHHPIEDTILKIDCSIFWMAKRLSGRRQLCAEHRQQHCRGVFGVVIDELVGNAQLGPARQWFATAGIAHKARVSAARDLDANALSLSEVVRGWPDLDRDMQAAIGLRGNAPPESNAECHRTG